MTKAPLLLAVLAAGAGGSPGASGRARAARLVHRMDVDARGPLALVEVTRTVEPAESGEAILDLALPDASTLSSVEVQDGGRWRPLAPSDDPHAAEQFETEAEARSVTPSRELYDDSASYRLRLVRGAAAGKLPFTIRYRFAVEPEVADGRLRLRFPAAPERIPTPAEVTVETRAGSDLQIAGARAVVDRAGRAAGQASGRATWEISWAPAQPTARDPGGALAARVATSRLDAAQSAVAFMVRARPSPAAAPPGAVLFVVDRSRSVGLPGLTAERDLVRRIVEALPPSTRFDALYFDRRTARLFPMTRPATREAIDAFESEMVPDRLQNGTDVEAALRDAGALVRREATSFGPRALLVLVTDGAFGDEVDGRALDRALGPTPGLELPVAAFAVRPADDEPIGGRARKALRSFAAARGGIARELHANQIDDVVPAALADLARGGDLGGLRLVADGIDRPLGDALAPGAALSGVMALPGAPPRQIEIEALAAGRSISAKPVPDRLAAAAVRPFLEAAAARRRRLLVSTALIGLVEPVLHAAASDEAPVKGSMDRMVIRNVLSLAYLPRARACYLNRTAATPALRDLTGKVRLAIELGRGEVDRATIESSTLGNPAVEGCLHDEAFAIEVPRAARSDAPVTAILNLVFRPRTPEKTAEVSLGAVGAEIDLVIEDLHRREASATPAPAPEPSR